MNKKKIIVIIVISLIIVLIGIILFSRIINLKKDSKNNVNNSEAQNSNVNYGISIAGYKIIGQWEINPKDYPEGYFIANKNDDNKTVLDKINPDSFSINKRIISINEIFEFTSTLDIAKYLEDISEELNISNSIYVSEDFEMKYKKTNQKNIPAEVFKKELEDLSNLTTATNYKEFEFKTNSGTEIALRICYENKEGTKVIDKCNIYFFPVWCLGKFPTVEESKDELIYNYDKIKISVIGGTDGFGSGISSYYCTLNKEIEL